MFSSEKTKVVVDTNIIVSAALSDDGNPARIFEMILSEEIQNFVTEEILEELREVLYRPKFNLKQFEREFILNHFEHFSVKVNCVEKFE